MNPKGTVEQSVNETSTSEQGTSAPNTALLASAQSSYTNAADTRKADASPSTQNAPVSPNGQLIDQTTRCEETGETSFCEDQSSHTQQLRNDTLPIGNKSEDKKGKKLELKNNVKHKLSEELNLTGESNPRGFQEIADLGKGNASPPSAESTSASQVKNKTSEKGSTKELQSSVSTSRMIGDEPPPQPCTETSQVEEQEKSRLDGTTESTFSGEEDDDEGEIDCKSNGASSSISHDHSSEDESPAPRLRRRCSVSDNDNDEEEEEDYDDDYYFDEKSTHSHGDEEIVDSTKDYKSRGSPITSELHEVDEGNPKDDCQVIDDKKAEANEKSVEKSRLVTLAADDNKKDPSYVPRVGAFYLHDLRDEVDEEETSSKAQSSVNYCRRPGMLAARWGHDLYVEKYQNPRTTEDIVRRYGYDIRKHGLENPPLESAIENEPANEGEPSGSGTSCHSRKGHVSFTKSHRNVISSREDYPPLQDSEARYPSSRRRDNARQGRKRLGNANMGNYQPDGHNTLPTERQGLIDRKGRAVVSNSETPVDEQDRRGRGGTLQINRRNQRQHFAARRGRGGAPLHSDRKHDGRDEDRDLVRKGRGPDVPSNPNNDRHAGDVRRVQFSSSRGNTNEGVDKGTSHRRSAEESEHLPSLQRNFQAPQAGKRYSANRQPSQQQQQQQIIGTPGPPDAATLEYCRSVDPSLVAALLQHKQQNPEAFAAVQAGMMPPAYGRRLPMGVYPDQGRYHGDMRPIRGNGGGGVSTYEQQPKPLDTGSSQRGF